jgi:hypothetical protein
LACSYFITPLVPVMKPAATQLSDALAAGLGHP